MTRWVTAALALVLTCPLAGRAEDAPKKPLGTWTRRAGDVDLKFEIRPADMSFTLEQGGNRMTFDIDYGVTKDGVLFGRVHKVEKVGTTEGPEAGDLFSFRFAVDKDTLTLSELKATRESAEARQLVEGEYKKK
jgi:hypothetical protein